jgi:hypothetical protein
MVCYRVRFFFFSEYTTAKNAWVTAESLDRHYYIQREKWHPKTGAICLLLDCYSAQSDDDLVFSIL